ncbi:MAG: hypothetical protein ACJAZF_002731 [Granulosicoccus sp.]|jgi:hypothetical protein
MVNSYKASRALCRLPGAISATAIMVTSLSINVVGANNDRVVSDSVHTLPSFTANYQLSHEPSREIFARFKITIGEEGLRIDQEGEGGTGAIILNNYLDKMWLLDRNLKIFYEVPLQVKNDSSSSYFSTRNETSGEESKLETKYFAAFIQIKPCSGMSSERLLNSENDSADMQIWLCKIEGKIVEKQWFDIEYGLVVKSESFDGMVAKITDIKKFTQAGKYFEPPSKYRLVTLDEIVSISQPLEKY